MQGVEVNGEDVTGVWGDHPVAFSRNEDGVLACHFEGEIDDDEEGITLVLNVER